MEDLKFLCWGHTIQIKKQKQNSYHTHKILQNNKLKTNKVKKGEQQKSGTWQPGSMKMEIKIIHMSFFIQG